jgi:hypothetical protein
MAHSCIPLVLGLILSQNGTALASDLPHVRAENGAQQFVLHGKPFLILGGERGRQARCWRTTEPCSCWSPGPMSSLLLAAV